jgi:DNA polymerase-3 subunit epsilon
LTTWADGPLLGFDTETTGVSPGSDRIVTAALVRLDAAGVRATTWLLDPGVEIPDGASAIHGITTAHARAHGRPPAQALAEIAGELTEALATGTPVVAFNASFDLTILETELARHGLPTVAARLGRAPGPILDPLVLDRALARYRPGKRRLADLCAVYGVRPSAELHTAEVDVMATLDVLRAIGRRHPELAAMPAEQVHAWQITAHRMWAERFNAWRRSQGYTGTGARTCWPAARLEEDLLDVAG